MALGRGEVSPFLVNSCYRIMRFSKVRSEGDSGLKVRKDEVILTFCCVDSCQFVMGSGGLRRELCQKQELLLCKVQFTSHQIGLTEEEVGSRVIRVFLRRLLCFPNLPGERGINSRSGHSRERIIQDASFSLHTRGDRDEDNEGSENYSASAH